MDLAQADPGLVAQRVPQKFVGKQVQLSRRVVIPNHLAPVPSLYVGKNRGKRVGSCGPKRFRTKLMITTGLHLGLGPFFSGIALSGNNLFVGSVTFFEGTVIKYDATMGVAINDNFITGLNGSPLLAVAPTPTPTPTVKELVWENIVTGEHSIWVMQDGVPDDVISLPTISVEWNIAATGDFLGTGQADLVWENTVTGQRSIWIMNNGVPQFAISLPTISTQWHIAAAADFLGTGHADLVWENTVTGEHSIWVLNNGIPLSSTKLPTISTEWLIVN